MKYMSVSEIREAFLKFFEEKEHLRLKSYSLVPENDKSLLLINAGMAPMKAYFTGLSTPPSKRIATCQKCIRTGDIENVGITNRHATFFEMLGNFSFGDYFKNEVIPWAWEFCTEVLEMPVDKLYPSVYFEDDEAFDIWYKKVGIPKDRIFRMGKEDNFWEVGTVGPCGPCSEIYFDLGPEFGCGKEGCTVGCDCDRYTEFWNLVFTQFDKKEDGSYEPLASPNIDTGMGLERMGVIMQGVKSIMDIDTMKSIRDAVCTMSGYAYGSSENKDISVRIITDHIRAVSFLLADGVLPNNEGRGYVLRRLLRRAARHGKQLGIDRTFMPELCQVVVSQFGDAYPELNAHKEYILKILSVEENRFYETLDQGLEYLMNHIEGMKNGTKILGGADAFKLYDTYGFPLELMKEILEEANLQVDEEGFNTEMEKQREMSRGSREESTFMGSDTEIYSTMDIPATEFAGYDCISANTPKVISLIIEGKETKELGEGAEGIIVLDMTTFYAEGGGQVGDIGTITTESGVFEVCDCKKVDGDKYIHIGKVRSGKIEVGGRCTVSVDEKCRKSTMRNHTATHLLHKALREVLGGHVTQAGSYVSSERLRFDLTHFEPITYEELDKIENMVNDAIFEALDVNTVNTDIESAANMGAMALFGEKYGDVVRVVNIGSLCAELCGGTHVSNTSQIGLFKILSESSVSAGVRRIEALSGKSALDYYKGQDVKIKALAASMKTTADSVFQKAESTMVQLKELQKELEKAKTEGSANIVDDLWASDAHEEVNGVHIIAAKVDNIDAAALRTLGDKIRDKAKGAGALALFGVLDGKVSILVMASDDLAAKGLHAGNIVKEVAPIVSGRGGGKPNMAQAGGSDASKVDEAIAKARELIKSQVIK
ncbi:MAG: alanine--tRNA ligase [Defluviitaleaceae bacterium]|nr:alanine--tRNA ligase [Defluviitaleaceae bacterium]